MREQTRKEIFEIEMADISQVNMEETSREYGEEEARLMNEIMKNNAMMLKLQKQIVELQEIEEEKKGRRKDKRTGRDG